MADFRVSTLTVGLLLAIGAIAACSDDASDKLSGGRGSSGGASSGGSSGGDGDGGPGTNPGGPPPEEVLFRKVEPDLEQKCGGQCHTDQTYKPQPPGFLAKPDAYKSIKAQPGVVVADFYQSTLLTKGAHAGPAVGADPTFETKVIDWLKMESAVIQGQKKPSTDPFTVVNGPNTVPLDKAALGGLTGVKLTFNASLVGGILSLDKMAIVAGPGSDVHVLRPKFYRIPAKEISPGVKEVVDPADTFSNADQTVPANATTAFSPGTAFFAGAGWTPFDLAADKIRIEIEKLEPGKVSVLEKPKVCKDPAGFGTNFLPQLRAAQANGTCPSCHGNGLAGLSLNSTDNALICNQVLGKINEANVAQSIIITKVSGGMAHNGGTIQNPAPAAWATAVTNAYNTYMKQ